MEQTNPVNSRTPHRSCGFVIAALAILVLFPLLFWSGDAAAHGKRPNLLKHCIDVYSGKGIKLPFDRK